MPYAVDHFAWVAKRQNCTTEEVEDEEEIFDEIFDDEGNCPNITKQSVVECGVEKFKVQLEDFKNKLNNADNSTKCKV